MTSLEHMPLGAISSQARATSQKEARCSTDAHAFSTKLHDLAKSAPLALKSLFEADQGVDVILGGDGSIAGYKTSPGFHFADHDLRDLIDRTAARRLADCLTKVR